jgi:aspartate/methionine/tyrosine aminotransferase
MFLGIQKGAVEAFKLSNDWFQKQNEIYQERRALVWKIFDALNCTYNPNIGGLFVWAKIPADENSEALTDKLLYEKDVFITPGTIFGTNGEGYIRASLCVDTATLNEVLKRITA